ncbi:MAG: response regulator [Butyrivibrio sp.]|nr:response regulator [Butyrivibrio sp.]
MKKRINNTIIGGMLFVIALSIIVFLSMNHYMDKQTSKDVKIIAQTYLEGITKEELFHYDSIAEIRFNQIEYLKTEVAKKIAISGKDDAKAYAEAICEAAEFQSLRTCALISGTGNVESVYGNPLTSLDNKDYILSSLESNLAISTSGDNSNEKLIIWVAPASYPMSNGEMSVGILCCRRMSLFIKKLHLDADGTLAYFHLLNKDGTYVVHNSDSYGENFYQRLEDHSTADEGTMEEILSSIANSIETGEDYSFAVTFTNPDTNVKEKRNIYIMNVPDSDWTLAAVVPYGVLDMIISDMGHSRNKAMIISVIVLGAGILAVFLIYFMISQRQMKELDLARTKAEDAMIEAETATEEATTARENAENALIEAETANEEAMKAREDAEKAKEEAERAREEADQANKAKSEFLSNMSHDIRTPMNAIVGMTAIAQSHLDNKSQVDDCLKKINLSGKQLLGLINDILDMSKIESGKLTLNYETISLKETMETMCDIIRPQLKDKKQNFDIFINNIICEEVYCDSVRLNQVLLNFLSNAMKFTPEGGTISISLNQEESSKGDEYVKTHLCVVDNGIGMSKEFKEKIFTAFEREDNKRVHKIQGTGLGMTITKYIVDAMGGEIEVESEQGKGTTFHVTLDLKKETVHEKDMILPNWKILVVDDNKDLCESAMITLKELGTNPMYCTDGHKAIEIIDKAHREGEDFFAVLIDYKMDDIDGIETTRRIRHLIGDKVPISIISAYDWIDIEDEAREAGVNGFISKPLFKSTIYHEFYPYTEEGKNKQEVSPEKDNRQIDLTGLKILLAEDQYVNAMVATTLLEESGAVIEHAEDGQLALDMFEKSKPGEYKVILMDLRMPNMNGFEATRAIRGLEREDAGTIPIIAMTADAFAEDVKKCLDAGMNGHIAKPIDIDLLKKTLAKYL